MCSNNVITTNTFRISNAIESQSCSFLHVHPVSFAVISLSIPSIPPNPRPFESMSSSPDAHVVRVAPFPLRRTFSNRAPELVALVHNGFLNDDFTPAPNVAETYMKNEDGRTLVLLTKTEVAENTSHAQTATDSVANDAKPTPCASSSVE